MNDTEKEARLFRHLVLNALWVLILCAFGKKTVALPNATNFQSGAIRFGDEYGTPGEDAQRVRRNVTYGGNLN